MKEGRKPEYPEKTPGDELQKMPQGHEDSSPKRDSNPRSSIGGRLGKQDMLTVTPRVAPVKCITHRVSLPCDRCLCFHSKPADAVVVDDGGDGPCNIDCDCYY